MARSSHPPPPEPSFLLVRFIQGSQILGWIPPLPSLDRISEVKPHKWAGGRWLQIQVAVHNTSFEELEYYWEKKSSKICSLPRTGCETRFAKEYPGFKTLQAVKLASKMWLSIDRQSSALQSVRNAKWVQWAKWAQESTVGPSQDWAADNQSPMKRDNRDHRTLSSPVTSDICFKQSLLLPFLLWTLLQKICPEHLSEEVNWLFCRRLSALRFPPPPLLTPDSDPIHPGECCKFLLRPFTRQSNHC